MVHRRRRTSSRGISRQTVRTSSGSPTSRTCPPGRLACTWRSWSTSGAGWLSAGRWRRTSKRRLVLAALKVAQQQAQSVVLHSDHGTQYTSIAFGQRCRQAGVKPSMSTVGDADDNALCESFFASLECELIDRRTFKSHTEARMAVFQYIEGWYNPRRRHSALDYQSPINYEKQHVQAA